MIKNVSVSNLGVTVCFRTLFVFLLLFLPALLRKLLVALLWQTSPAAQNRGAWSTNELFAYNITIQTQSVVAFFGHEPHSIDHLDPNIFPPFNPSTSVPTSIPMETRRFLGYLHLISQPSAEDSMFNDFANSVLEVTNFEQQIGTILIRRHRIPFTICGDTNRKAIPDICLLSTQLRVMPLLLVQRDKPAFGSSGPEPPVIAGAIATFQYNNRNGPSHSRHDDNSVHYGNGNSATPL